MGVIMRLILLIIHHPLYLIAYIDFLYKLSFEKETKYIFKSTSGVPQGFNLGPLLFVAFINGLIATPSNYPLVYVDDLKIYPFFERCQLLSLNIQTQIL